jgi:hypothetical protein
MDFETACIMKNWDVLEAYRQRAKDALDSFFDSHYAAHRGLRLMMQEDNKKKVKPDRKEDTP